jgi:hypothetical protein
MRGRRGTGGLEGLVVCCRVTAVSGGPSIANTGARLTVVAWVTCGAAAWLALPGWLASITQVPAAVWVTVLPFAPDTARTGCPTRSPRRTSSGSPPRPPVAVKVADPPAVPAADAVKLTG